MWNAANQFTGWVDVPLTNKGINEAIEGGNEISSLPIDEIHTSTLIRAQMTAMIALAQHESRKTPIISIRIAMSIWARMNQEWLTGRSQMIQEKTHYQCLYHGN